ncbi:hypothetical protein BH11PLA1_BH11PLA1_19570 [soil metagenome]
MSTSRGFFRLGMIAGLLSAFAGSALALPKIIDKVPADAFVTMVIANPAKFEKSIKSGMAAMGLPSDQIDINAMLSMMNLVDAVNVDNPIVAYMPVPKMDGGDGDPSEHGFVFIPVKDYAAFAKAFGGVGTADSEKLEVNGDTMYVKNIGDGYAALMKNEADSKAFAVKPGMLPGHRKLISSLADKVADASDMMLLVNVDLGREHIRQGVTMMKAQMQQQMAAMGQDASNMATSMYVVDAFVDQARSLVLGLKLTEGAVMADAVATFIADQPLGKVSATGGNSGALLAKLPDRDFLVAGATDFTNSAWKDFFAKMPLPTVPGAEKGAAMFDMTEAMKSATGGSFLVGFNPGGFSAGFLTQTITFTAAKDPAAAIEASRAMMAKLEESKLLTKYKFTPDAAEVGGKKVAEYSMQFADNPEVPQMGQMMIYMFGPYGGPSGYIAPVDGGYVTTFSKSTPLMTAAVDAAGGKNALSNNAELKKTMAMLPGGRISELYLGPKVIVNSVKPLLQAFANAKVDYTVPEGTPPFAFAAATGESSLQGHIHIPFATVKAMKDFYAAVEEKMHGGEPGEDGGEPTERKTPATPATPK